MQTTQAKGKTSILANSSVFVSQLYSNNQYTATTVIIHIFLTFIFLVMYFLVYFSGRR